MWVDEAAAGLRCPVLLVAGDQDKTSFYRRGVRRIFSCGPAPVDRFLLTYRGGTHNDVVPFSPPTSVQEGRLWDFIALRGVSLDARRVCDLNVHFMVSFLGWVVRGVPDGLKALKEPIGSGSFDHELPPVANRPFWPCQLQHTDDTSSLGFALEHAPIHEAGPAAPPAWLYAWERE